MRILTMTVLLMLLTSCATPEVKAPCDYYGHFCGKKIAINHI